LKISFFVFRFGFNYLYDITVITIETDSEQKAELLLKYAGELGLTAKIDEHRVLTDEDMVFGIGRKVTSEELIEYMTLDYDEEPIDISVAFAKYKD
jgi:hypothetical protein